MKSHSLKTLLIIATCATGLIFTSCKKEEVEPTSPTTTTPTPPTITEPFFANIDGVEFIETDLIGTVNTMFGTLEIKASNSNGYV